ncbi:MAG TPA: SRPBCC family protein [Rubrobacter sp.]|nr:SRPBCC family protein [Rubrobacter sp.]
MKKRTSVYIDRAPEHVFGYLVGLNDAGWRAPFPEMKLVSESYEGVGATHIEVRKMLRRRIETLAEAVIYEPDRRWAVRRASGPVRPQVTYTLQPEGNGTRLWFAFDVPVLKSMARVLGPLVRLGAPLVERSARSDLERLKQTLERNADDRKEGIR